MKLLTPDQIKVSENRIRKEFSEEANNALAESIRTKGLFHAVVTRGDGILVAGERRIRAIRSLSADGKTFKYNGADVPLGQVPTTDIGDLTSLAAREAEYEENVVRMDLTLAEKAIAVKELHDLRVAQRGDGVGKRGPQENRGQTLKATAEETGTDPAETRMLLTIAQHIDDPDVAKAVRISMKEARKVIQKKHEKWLQEELAERYDVSAKFGNFLNDSFTTFARPDFFDCIVVDPPYGIGSNEFGSQSAIGHDYEDSTESFKHTLLELAEAITYAAGVESHLYLFCDPRRFADISKLFTRHAWRVWPKPFIWVKGNGMLPEPDFGPRYTYECILFASKGRKRITATYPDVITCPAVAGSKLIHAAQKPVEVYVNLLKRSCTPGDKVWDPMAGSGTIFHAAKELSLLATGHEVNKSTYAAALIRLEEAT